MKRALRMGTIVLGLFCGAAACAAPYPTADQLRQAIVEIAVQLKSEQMEVTMLDARKEGVKLPLMAAGLRLGDGVCVVYYNDSPEEGLIQFFEPVTAADLPIWLNSIAAIGAAAIIGAKRDLARSIELVSITALLSFTPPLIGFTMFFCCMHSARHVLRTRDYSHAGTLKHLLGIAAWPMLATAVGVAVVWWLFSGKPLDMRLAQLLFVGLAALTVPHMMVVERVRFTGWMMGRKETR